MSFVAEPPDLEACNDLCRKVHGHDRSGELEDGFRAKTATVVERAGRMTGYATAIGFFAHAVGDAIRRRQNEGRDIEAARSPQKLTGPNSEMPCRLRRRSRLLRGRRRNLPSNVGVIPTAPRAHNSPACPQARHGQQRALTDVCQRGAEHNDGPGDAVGLKSSSSSFVHFNAHVHGTIMCPRATGNGHVSARNKSKTKRWIVQLVVSSPDNLLERASPQKSPHVAPA